MNKYIIPICNLVSADIWIKKYSARSIIDCQDKIMREFSETYDEDFTDYREFLSVMDKKYDYSIGSIIDVETI